MFAIYSFIGRKPRQRSFDSHPVSQSVITTHHTPTLAGSTWPSHTLLFLQVKQAMKQVAKEAAKAIAGAAARAAANAARNAVSSVAQGVLNLLNRLPDAAQPAKPAKPDGAGGSGPKDRFGKRK